MNVFLPNLASTAIAILERAQPNFNGGIFAYIGNSIDLSSNVTSSPSINLHLKNVLLSNGFFWALLCGILWILAILLIVIGLACLHCRRNSTSKITIAYRQVAWRLQRMENRRRANSNYVTGQLILFAVILILCVVPLILAFVANAQLNLYLRAQADSRNEAGLFPQLNVAVERVVQFMRTLAPHARIASKPAVDETIRRTLLMAEKTREKFQAAYKKELGVTDLMNATDRLTDCLSGNYFGFQTFTADLFFPFEGGSKMSALDTLNQISSVNQSLVDALTAYNSLKSSCEINYLIQCAQFETLLETARPLLDVQNNSIIPTIKSNAVTFVNALFQAQQTPDKIKEKAAEGARTSESMTVSMNARFDKELNSTELILNTTNSKWDLMESSMIQQERSIREITAQFFKQAPGKVNEYEKIRNALFVVCLVLLLGVFIFAIYVSICGVMVESMLIKRRHLLKCCNLLLFIILAMNVLLATAVFLISGYLQTDACRYLKEKPTTSAAVNNPTAFNSTLQLDLVVNNFIKRNWQTIVNNVKKQNSSSAFPLPKPRDLFYGLNTVCQNNGSIMVAINALESFDAASMNDPTPMQLFLAKGKRLLATVLNETDSAALLPADTVKNLMQLNQSATLFIATNKYDEALKLLESPLYSTDLHLILRNWTSLAIKLEQKSMTLEQLNRMSEVSKYLNRAVRSLDEMERARQHLVKSIVTLKKNRDVFSIINDSLTYFQVVTKSTTNKTHMIGVAMKYYSSIIEQETLMRAGDISTFSAFAIMKVIGPCRPLYEAFVAVTSAACDTTVPPLAVFYFTLGWSVFLATSLLLGLTYVLSKHADIENDVSANGKPVQSNLQPESTLPMLDNGEYKVPIEKVNGKETQL